MESKALRQEWAMANKPEFVDMISDATRQRRPQLVTRVIEPGGREKSHLSHWPPQRWADWRMEKLTPWKLKPWKSEG